MNKKTTALQDLIKYLKKEIDNNLEISNNNIEQKERLDGIKYAYQNILNISEILLTKEKEEFIEGVDRICDLFGYTHSGEDMYYHWYIKEELRIMPKKESDKLNNKKDE